MRLALPKKPRLIERSRRILSALGFTSPESPLQVRFESPDGSMSARFLKLSDIAFFLAAGTVDIGVCSDEWIEEIDPGLDRLAELDWWQTSLCLVGPSSGTSGGSELRIASEYPTLATRLASSWGLSAEVVPVHGSAESCVPDLADLALETVETGATLHANDLAVIRHVKSCALHVVARRGLLDNGHTTADVERVVRAVRQSEPLEPEDH